MHVNIIGFAKERQNVTKKTPKNPKQTNQTELKRKNSVEEVDQREKYFFQRGGEFISGEGEKVAKDGALREAEHVVNGYVYLQIQSLLCFREFPRCHIISTDKYRINMASDCYDVITESDVYFKDANRVIIKLQ